MSKFVFEIHIIHYFFTIFIFLIRKYGVIRIKLNLKNRIRKRKSLEIKAKFLSHCLIRTKFKKQGLPVNNITIEPVNALVLGETYFNALKQKSAV